MRLPILLLALVACASESDDRKLERLQTDRAVAYLTVLKMEQDSAPIDSLMAAKRRLLLADRDLNAFMRGK